MNRKAHAACRKCSGRRRNLSSGAFRSEFRVWVTVWVRTENQRRRNCAAVNKEYLYILTIFPGSLREPERAVLQNPFLRWIIDIDQAEALGIAAVPLEIIGQRPVKKATDVGMFAPSAEREQIAMKEIDPIHVVNCPVKVDMVITAQSALRHVERQPVAVKEKGITMLSGVMGHLSAVRAKPCGRGR